MLGRVTQTLLVSVLWYMVVTWGFLAVGQEMGAEAEMDRLEQRAEELIAQGDPEGASLAIGKAGLMASELAKREREDEPKQLFKEAQRLFRAQEQAYRAIALFERAGGNPPASSGVCHELNQAERTFQDSVKRLEAQALKTPGRSTGRFLKRRLPMAREWDMTIQDLREDFGCPS